MANSALDIANFFVFLMSSSCDDLSNMKLNKIMYYAQGHYLQKTGSPLYNEKILAWQHGPVVKEVYTKYKDYSDRQITSYDVNRLNSISDDTKSFLVDIAREYGRYTASTLRNMTHKPKAPWSQVNEGEEIPIALISQYFKANEKVISPLEIAYSEDDFIGHRDAEGYLVLPEEWHDETI